GGGGHPAGGHDQREGADPATGAKGEAAAAAVGLLGHGEVGHGLVGEGAAAAGSRGAEGHAAVAVAAAARAEAGACELAHRDRGRDVDGEGGGGHPAGGHDQREGADPATGAKGEAAAAAIGLLGHGELRDGLIGESAAAPSVAPREGGAADGSADAYTAGGHCVLP